MPSINAVSMLIGGKPAVAAYSRGVDVAPLLFPNRVRSILNKFNASALIAGVDGILRFGYQPGNYRESTGQTLAAADQQVGLVVDAAGVPGQNELVGYSFLDGWSALGGGSAASQFVISAASAGGLSKTLLTIGKTYRVRYNATVSGTTAAFYNANGTSNLLGSLLSGAQEFIFTATNVWLYIRLAGVGTVTFSQFELVELPGIHASQSTSGFQPVLRNTSGIQSWQFDGTDDRFSMTFPSGSGWNNTTIITARSTGAVTETGQNVEGTHLFQVSGHVYGRFYIPNGSTISASELAALQRFANVLSGYSA